MTAVPQQAPLRRPAPSFTIVEPDPFPPNRRTALALVRSDQALSVSDQDEADARDLARMLRRVMTDSEKPAASALGESTFGRILAHLEREEGERARREAREDDRERTLRGLVEKVGAVGERMAEFGTRLGSLEAGREKDEKRFGAIEMRIEGVAAAIGQRDISALQRQIDEKSREVEEKNAEIRALEVAKRDSLRVRADETKEKKKWTHEWRVALVGAGAGALALGIVEALRLLLFGGK